MLKERESFRRGPKIIRAFLFCVFGNGDELSKKEVPKKKRHGEMPKKSK
jgi:hypothetical protein